MDSKFVTVDSVKAMQKELQATLKGLDVWFAETDIDPEDTEWSKEERTEYLRKSDLLDAAEDAREALARTLKALRSLEKLKG